MRRGVRRLDQRTAGKALASFIQEAYVHGVSSRSVDDLIRGMGMSGVSKIQVSRLCSELNERVGKFLNRPIDGDWPICAALAAAWGGTAVMSGNNPQFQREQVCGR